jgi:hypothetical protein
VLAGTVAAALWATVGLGVGALVRNQVGTLVGLCAWMLLVENLLLPLVPDAGRFTPALPDWRSPARLSTSCSRPLPPRLSSCSPPRWCRLPVGSRTLHRDVP